MQEITFSKSAVYFDYLSKNSLVDNKDLRANALIFNEFCESKDRDPYFKDMKLPFDQQISWLSDHIRDYMLRDDKMYLEHIKNVDHRLIFHEQGEGSIMRNHLNYPDPKTSPDFVGMYIVHAPKNDEMIFQYDDQVKKNLLWHMPIEPKKFVCFHANVNYYFPVNQSKEKRIAILFRYKIEHP